MQLHITGHQVDITDAIRDYISNKLEKLDRHSNRITSANVVVRVEKLEQCVEATVLVTQGELHAEGSAEDLYAAIDSLVDKLTRQLHKHKEKLTNRR